MKLYLFLWLFAASRLLQAQAVIITEIFADPTPSHGLPEREYLEIFNRSPAPVFLKGYTLSYGNTRVTFPDSVITPGEYLIACRSTYAPEFASFGKVVSLSGLSLNNNGNILKLSDAAGNEVHRVNYASSWYTPGRSEGYSLEIIDLRYPCRGKDNWASSAAEHGGTPGRANSVARDHPDFTPPELLKYDLQENRVLLVFNEVLSSDFAENPERFEVLSGNAGLTRAAFLNESRETVVLTLNQAPDGDLKLKIREAKDCTGNTAPDITVRFESLQEPLPGDILLSEILFNPPPGGDDFVEIYNTREQRFNLKNWQLARLNAAGEITGHVIIAPTQTILPGKSHLAFSRSPSFLREHYPVTGTILEVPSLPAYNNDMGTVLLLKPDSTVFDRFTYSEKMHASRVLHPKGVSLERVSFRPQQNEWTSASSDAGFATPGAPNSRREDTAAEPFFSAEPRVFHPDTSTPFTRLTYRLNSGEAYAAIRILDRHGRTVRTLSRNHLLGSSGEIPWNGTDDHGTLLPPGYYVFVIQVSGTGINRIFYAKTVIGIK